MRWISWLEKAGGWRRTLWRRKDPWGGSKLARRGDLPNSRSAISVDDIWPLGPEFWPCTTIRTWLPLASGAGAHVRKFSLASTSREAWCLPRPSYAQLERNGGLPLPSTAGT